MHYCIFLRFFLSLSTVAILDGVGLRRRGHTRWESRVRRPAPATGERVGEGRGASYTPGIQDQTTLLGSCQRRNTDDAQAECNSASRDAVQRHHSRLQEEQDMLERYCLTYIDGASARWSRDAVSLSRIRMDGFVLLFLVDVRWRSGG